jgi:hypothetical protein
MVRIHGVVTNKKMSLIFILEWAQRWKRSTIEDEDKPLGELKRTKGIWSVFESLNM